jgi:hypothetical protein
MRNKAARVRHYPYSPYYTALENTAVVLGISWEITLTKETKWKIPVALGVSRFWPCRRTIRQLPQRADARWQYLATRARKASQLFRSTATRESTCAPGYSRARVQIKRNSPLLPVPERHLRADRRSCRSAWTHPPLPLEHPSVP